MAIDKGKLIEKMKGMTEEEKTLFQDAFREAFPEKTVESGLSMEEVFAIRELLTGEKTKLQKKKGNLLESLFGG